MDKFCQLQKLMEWKLWILKNWSWSSKLFITSFLTTFTSTKTLYGIIGNNCIRFKIVNQICEFGRLWTLPEGEQCKVRSLSWRYELFKISFQTTFISMTNFLLCTVLPPGASKVDQTWKFDNFLNLIQLFPMTPYSVLVKMNDVTNVICNNFEYHD